MTRTGVVIVTYNSAGVIERCLTSCGDLPVVVVDNASRDATCELVRRHALATLIANPGNYGFAEAVNQGVLATDTQLVLLLNPDTELKTPIAELETACLEPGTGLAAGQHTVEASARRLFASGSVEQQLLLLLGEILERLAQIDFVFLRSQLQQAIEILRSTAWTERAIGQRL